MLITRTEYVFSRATALICPFAYAFAHECIDRMVIQAQVRAKLLEPKTYWPALETGKILWRNEETLKLPDDY
jgi:hypothetical protein